MVTVPQPPAGTSHLSASVPAKVSRGRALEVLGGDGRATWLGETVELAGDTERERHLVDLELRVGEQLPSVTFRKAAYVDVGPARARRLMPIEVDISWQAAGLAPLFPVFSGKLRWADNELTLDGYYAPPGGGIGIMADRLLLNVAARGTARVLLEKIAAAMASEAA
ncbi:MAG TPA: hypothetical protein VL687_05115 [Methylomirabilota bacterium]|jgi:hypothetical protein|nr:hypothetical protein [Methylomirabilota bacterium]